MDYLEHTTTRFHFESALGAAKALLIVLLDARLSKRTYRFTGISVESILRSGLLLEGDLVDIVKRVEIIDGCSRLDE